MLFVSIVLDGVLYNLPNAFQDLMGAGRNNDWKFRKKYFRGKTQMALFWIKVH